MNAAEKTYEAPWIGRKIDKRYEIVELLGAGGAGAVYRARSLRIPRDFAIKIIELPVDSSERKNALERIRQEVVALAQIRHPHVVDIVEAARIDESHIAIVTEFIEGKNFDQAWVDGDLEFSDVIEVALQISMALQAVHNADLLHRDLKPENVLVRRIEGGALHACLVDFGIVKSEGGPELTQGFVGTPAYAPPEMVTSRELGPQTDLFGIGSLIYFALEGRGPFAHENVWASLRLHSEWTGPDTDSYTIDEELASLLRSLMAREMEDRPSSAVEVVERLRAIEQDTVGLEHEVAPDSYSFAVGPDSVVWQADDGIRRFDFHSRVESEVPYIPIHVVPEAADDQNILCIADSNVHVYREDGSHRVIRTDFDQVTAAAIDGENVWIAGDNGELLEVNPVDRKTFTNGNGPIRDLMLDSAGGIAIADDQSFWVATTRTPLEPIYRFDAKVRQIFRSKDGFLLGIVTDDRWRVLSWRTGEVRMEGPRSSKALAYSLAGRELVAIVAEDKRLSTVSTVT